MEDLLLDSISEKLSGIDQKLREMVKTTGETNRSIDQIQSRLSFLESIKKLAIREIPPPQLVEPKINRPDWSLAPEKSLQHILIPILVTLGTMAALSFVLTSGLRTSLLLPYFRLPSSNKIITPSSTNSAKDEQLWKQIKKGTQAKKFKGLLSHFSDSVGATHP